MRPAPAGYGPALAPRDQEQKPAAPPYDYGQDPLASFASHGEAIQRLAPPEECRARTQIFQQGAAPAEVIVVERGFVKLSCLSEDGKELIVGVRSRGAMLGAASAIIGMPHPVSATTLSGCLLRRVPLGKFFELVRADAQFCWHLHEVHCRELYDQASQLVALRYLSARQRLENLLWQIISVMEFDARRAPARVRLPLKFLDLARLIGITAEHFSRVLKQMEQESIIRRENGALVILNPQELYHPA
jgi:CRP-like cAMP-binding protein